MRDSHGEIAAAIQVVCLGSAGGPAEDNVTGFLVRATALDWAKGSLLAVDAGSHLAAITRILKNDFPLYSLPETSPTATTNHKPLPYPAGETPSPREVVASPINIRRHYDEASSSSPNSSRQSSPTPTPITTLGSGPFAGLPFPYASARANAAYVVREYVSTYLITHPHLDHSSGFVINTAAFHNTTRPKRLAALPFTVNAIKTHIFNDIIWPNLTDEDGGVGFVTFQRLAEGGNIHLGEGRGRGYIEVCDGLAVKGFKVSHGQCVNQPRHVHRGSIPNIADGLPQGLPLVHGGVPPGNSAVHPRENRSLSFSAMSTPGTPLANPTVAGSTVANEQVNYSQQGIVDSSAYFVRAEQPRIPRRTSSTNRSSSAPAARHHSQTQHAGQSVRIHHAPSHHPSREILMFGDVEPDSISLSPRTARVWLEAAPKIAAGVLKGIFIECSYTDAHGDAVLFGHLAPRHLISELASLADMVIDARKEREKERLGRKRKRSSRHLERERHSRSRGGGADSDEKDEAKRSRSAGRSVDDRFLRRQQQQQQQQQHVFTVATGMTASGIAVTSNGILPPDEAMTDARDASDVRTPPRHSTPHINTFTTPSTTTAQAARNALARYTSASGGARMSTGGYTMADDVGGGAGEGQGQTQALPLEGVTVVVIHVKDTLTDGPPVGEQVLAELQAHEAGLMRVGRGLGCQFEIAKEGKSYWF